MTPHTTRAFILRTVDYRDSDRIMTLLTQEAGKVSAIAKGARSSRRRFGGALEPFSLLEVSLLPGRGRDRLAVLSEATTVRANQGISTSLERMGSAAFITELIREITVEGQPDRRTFQLLSESLELLSTESVLVRPVTLSSALRVLALGGFSLSATACNACAQPVPAGKKAYFDPGRGGVICTPCGGGPILLEAQVAGALATLERSTLAESSTLELEDRVLDQMEYALDLFLEQQIEKPLKSTGFRGQIRDI